MSLDFKTKSVTIVQKIIERIKLYYRTIVLVQIIEHDTVDYIIHTLFTLPVHTCTSIINHVINLRYDTTVDYTLHTYIYTYTSFPLIMIIITNSRRDICSQLCFLIFNKLPHYIPHFLYIFW